MTRAFILALVLVAAGCDTPDPLQPTNPYDPEYPLARAGSPPTGLTVAEATPTSVTLAWVDESAFETGYQVFERVTNRDGEEVDELVATLPPDTERYAIEDLRDVLVHEYRVRAVPEGTVPFGTPDAISAPIRVRYPLVRQYGLDYASTSGVPRGELSGDGTTLFLPGASSSDGQTVAINDVASGQRLGTVVVPTETLSLIGVSSYAALPGDRVAMVGQKFSEVAETFAPTVYTVSRDGVVDVTPLHPDLTNCQPFAISPNGTRVASICPTGDDVTVSLYAWALPSGEQIKLPVSSLTSELIALSETSALLRIGTAIRAVSLTDGDLIWQVSIATQAQVAVRPIAATQSLAFVAWEAQSSGSYVTQLFDSRTGTVQAQWDDSGKGALLDARGDRVFYSATSTRTHIGVVSSADGQRILSGLAGEPVAARLTETGVVTVSKQGWIFEWDFSQPWEVIPDASSPARTTVPAVR
ncbi:MAG: hypothetical protein Rubg2KO_22710 [Rubricoccaceae bacterium]